ncbi:MAG: DNA cytosine methyltransferase [Ruminococcus sp.]|nr:DNA cytosine methyltransferase [Ruminococcus sp.]
MGMGGNNTPFVVEESAESESKQFEMIDNHPSDSRVQMSESGVCQILSARMGTGGGNVPLVMESQPETKPVSDETPLTMTCGYWSQWNEDMAATLAARDYKDPQIVVKPKSIVRRLTPLECERLQGYPDNWTASESDSARYKALGNSVALPCVDYIMSGIADVLDS